MKIKHKGIRMFKQIRRMMSLAMLMPSFLLAALDYKQKFTQILDFISNDFIKAIGGLIIVGTCIYAYKNWSRNSWSDRHLTIFRNQDKSPYLFNFHAYEAKRKNDMVSGHTIIFGGTGAGKTTLIEFLITNCFKYEDLSILALDRNNGMRVMTEFLDGQYNDSNDFYINPFSLKDTSANCTFLVSWLAFMLNIGEDTKDEKEKNLKRFIQNDQSLL